MKRYMEHREAHTAAPQPIKVLTESGKQLTQEFQQAFEKWTEFLHSILPPEKNPDVQYPATDSREWREHFQVSPVLHQRFAGHLLKRVQEIETTKRFIDTHRKFYSEQMAKLIWMGLIAPAGKRAPNTIQIAGEAGSGKTILLGEAANALMRMQCEGSLEGAIAYIGHKGAHLNQQLFGSNLQERRLHRKAPFELREHDIRASRQYALQILGETCANTYFPWESWRALMRERIANETHALCRVKEHLQSYGGMTAFRTSCKDADVALETLARIIANRSVLLKSDPLHYAEFPLTSEHTSKKDAKNNFYQGDFGRHIPVEYTEKGLVYSVPDWDLTLGKEADPEEAKIGFLSKSHLLSDGCAKPHRGFITRTKAVLVDEAGNIPGHQIQAYFKHQQRSAGLPDQDTFVIVARAPREECDMELPRYDAISPRLQLHELINDEILPPLALDVFPSSVDDCQLEGSDEAFTQLINRHLTPIPLYTKLKLPQPWESDGIFVVKKENAIPLKERLEEQYRLRGINAQVLLHTENSSPESAGDIQGLMLEKREYPIHVVSTSALIGRALSWPNLQFVRTSLSRMSSKIAMDLARRLSHSRLHKEFEGFRTLFGQQLLRESDPTETLFHYLARSGAIPNSRELIPGQAVLSHERREEDAKIIARKPEAYPAEAVVPPKPHKGLGLRKARKRRAARRERMKEIEEEDSPSVPVPAAAQTHAQLNPRDLTIRILTNRMGIPLENRLQSLMGFIYENAELPGFMRKNWNSWSAKLGKVALQNFSKEPEQIIDAVIVSIQQAESTHRRNA